MSLINSTAIPSGATGYEIEQSLRFNDNESAYLSRTPSVASNRKTFTFSCWAKLSNTTDIALFGATPEGNCIKTKGSAIQFEQYGSGTNYYIKTSALLRDFSAWYHIVAVWDTTNSTEADRIRLYINGERATLANDNQPTLNYENLINSAVEHRVGHDFAGVHYMDGYMAEVNFVDGQALTASSFGETGDYGEWKPIEYSGSYGTNGFYLSFSNSGALGTDSSGNSNTWTVNNLVATDQMLDSPTNNFATFNPLDTTTSGRTLSEGNMKVSCTSSGSNISTLGMSTGKWYAEIYFASGTYERIGITNEAGTVSGLGETSNGWAKINNSARLYHNGSAPSYGVNLSAGDICMVAFDADAGKIWYGVNGTWDASGNPATAANPSQSSVTGNDFFFAVSSGSGTLTYVANFGQDSSFAGTKTAQGNQDGNNIGDFYYAPPTGFLALCTSNLPDVAVIPSEHFNAVLYTGNGGTQNITGVGFQPDFTWIKSRSYATDHQIYDSVRGTTKALDSQHTGIEETMTTGLTSFDTDGFTSGAEVRSNTSGQTYVAWNWKANGSGSSNTNGTTNSTVSANVDAGFSIVSYTGSSGPDTIGHGLSKAPEMIIVKDRSSAQEWLVYHHSLTDAKDKYLRLDTTSAVADNTFWNDTAPINQVFSVGDSQPVNSGHGDSYIAYCFHSVDGYSKVGSYTGNGNADGTFIYTGFRPAYIMTKRVNNTSHWEIHDIKRGQTALLFANLSIAEIDNSAYRIDSNANGVKIRNSEAASNANGEPYIYIAFAETPFKYSNAR